MVVDLFAIALMLSILLCALVTGLLLGFAIVVMPGINKLSDKEFLLAFKHMDGIIQNNQPLFILIWVGSIISIIGSLITGTMNLSGNQLYLLWIGSTLYLFGLQLPTIRFNIPLNNTLQELDILSLSESELETSRREFESPWNRWNRFRTVNGIVAVSILLLLLFQVN
ncbi:MAG: DUF1772 domain-containing protein [Candidatus Poseidoniales archaeon]|nr:MAG: DUF1772 domain-containing protein [Candidatus Poseidoniales archaeon]